MAIALLIALTTVLLVGGPTRAGPRFGGDTPYDPACQPTAVVHVC